MDFGTNAALYAALAGSTLVTGYVSTRIYADAAPPNTARPYIVYATPGLDISARGRIAAVDGAATIEIYPNPTSTSVSANDIGNAVKSAVDGLKVSLTGSTGVGLLRWQASAGAVDAAQAVYGIETYQARLRPQL